jgi:hypothetical protein
MKYTVRKTKEHDCLVLSKIMRDVDKQEIWSAGRFRPLEALIDGFNLSKGNCYTLFLNMDIVGIFGVSKVQDDTGVVWLMGSDNLTKYKKGFYEVSKEYLELFLKEFKTVFNYVDERNTTTSKWLQRLGFNLINREPEFGEDKIPFNLFLKERSYV